MTWALTLETNMGISMKIDEDMELQGHRPGYEQPHDMCMDVGMGRNMDVDMGISMDMETWIWVWTWACTLTWTWTKKVVIGM